MTLSTREDSNLNSSINNPNRTANQPLINYALNLLPLHVPTRDINAFTIHSAFNTRYLHERSKSSVSSPPSPTPLHLLDSHLLGLTNSPTHWTSHPIMCELICRLLARVHRSQLGLFDDLNYTHFSPHNEMSKLFATH